MRGSAVALGLSLWFVASSGGASGFGTSAGPIAYERSAGGGPMEIWVMNPDGSGQRKLADGYGEAWAPDGRSLAFFHGDGLYTIDVGGNGLRRLMDTRNSGDLDWSPDGRRIAVGSASGIVVVSKDGASITRLTNESDSKPRWSPNGRRIVFDRHVIEKSGANGSDIFVVDADGSDERRLTHGLGNDSPSWSPGGKRIAFSGWRKLGDEWDSGIYVMDADGSNQRQITATPHVNEGSPLWSPGGATIAFISGSSRRPAIHTITKDGKRHRRLARGSYPSWSSDGRSIVYKHIIRAKNSGNNSEIYVMAATGRNPTNLSNTQAPVQERSAAYSPRSP